MIANAPSAPPSAIEPVSPMNTSAGNALYQRKPIAPPISAAPMIARSSFVSKRWFGGPDRIQAITFIAVNVKIAMIVVPAARPSRPSVRLTPFAVPAITRNSSTYQPYERLRSSTPARRPRSAGAGGAQRSATPTVISAEQEQLPAAREPERAAVGDLHEVVGEADRGAAERHEQHGQRGHGVVARARERRRSPRATISSPPITGVPCLTTWWPAPPRGCAGRTRSGAGTR